MNQRSPIAEPDEWQEARSGEGHTVEPHYRHEKYEL